MMRYNRKFLFFAAIVMFGFNSMAQDVILKEDGSEIKVKILEITEQQIKYNDFDFQSGPIRNVNISDVFMIIYENGRKEVFNRENSTPKTTSTATTSQKTMHQPSELEKEFNRIGTNDNEMLIFFKKNGFTEYYNRFESACNQRDNGKILFNLGIGLTGLGIPFIIAGVYSGTRSVVFVVGCIFSVAGEILTIASIPVSAVAGVRKKAIKNDFARSNFGVGGYTYQPTLNFGITQNGGLGFTLNF